MRARKGAMTAEAAAQYHVSGQALAFVGCLGVAHAAWFAWRNEPSFIEPPAMLVISVVFLVIAAWMVTVKPDVEVAEH